MEPLFVITYRYREDLDADDLRTLTKRFMEVGETPGVIQHYSRLDDQGGFLVVRGDDMRATFKAFVEYRPWIIFEAFPVAPIAEAFPVIAEVYA